MTQPEPAHNRPITDYLTVVALSLLAYTLAPLLHEHFGHALTCAALGGHLAELGAFYVDCQYGNLPDLSIRLVALAGPSVSLLTGTVGLLVLGRLPKASTHLRYFVWLFGTISLMSGAGYFLFSGISGIGDLGTTRDGALYLATPEWLWRVVITVLGGVGYGLVIFVALQKMDALIGGEGQERVGHAQKLALTSYLTGALMSVLISLPNPHGFIIVLISAAASSLGGTSGLAWMMQMLNRKKPLLSSPLNLERRWAWVIIGFGAALIYGLIFGPTVRP